MGLYGNPPPLEKGGLGVFLRKCGILYLGDCHGEPSVSFLRRGSLCLAMIAKMKTALIGIYPRGRLLRGLLCGLFESGEGVLVLLALL